jgi:hypothetical protein
MKKIAVLTLALLAGLMLSAQESKNQKKKSEKVTFAVNMYCENCKRKIEKLKLAKSFFEVL